MHAFPHLYRATASGHQSQPVALSSAGLPELVSAPPAEFDGPGDQWSPETLLIAAVADCFVLSFRAVAAASKFDWTDLSCESVGKLERVDRVIKFTEITNIVRLQIPTAASETTAHRLLDKAESVCLISNSLNAEVQLEIHIDVVA